VTLAAGLLLAFALRLVQARRGEDAVARAVRAGARVGAMGYAIPGTVLAIALLAPLSWFDDVAARWSMPLLMGSSAALVLAYVLRFTAIPAGGLESGYARVPIALDQSARSLEACAAAWIAMKLQRKLTWDPAKEMFVNDAEANALRGRKARSAAYDIDAVMKRAGLA
jgi:iron(III) transport system permease protein